MNNLSSYCGLVDAKLRASNKKIYLYIHNYLITFRAKLCSPNLFTNYLDEVIFCIT